MISSEERYSKHQVTVYGLKMAYIDEGAGDPIIFLHGNPSSSYEWRNIIPRFPKIIHMNSISHLK